jgi:hypothetical protein
VLTVLVKKVITVLLKTVVTESSKRVITGETQVVITERPKRVIDISNDISAGKIEGINNKIKTLRRQGYGYPDDDYFFLKLFDASRKGYVRNPVAEKIPQDL